MFIRTLLGLTAGFLMAVLAAGCGKKKTETSTPSPESTPTGTFKDQLIPKASKPEVSTDPASFRAEFKANGQAASQKYFGKTIEMTGIVARMGDDPFDKGPFISLKAEGEWTVSCATTDEKPWLTVMPGSKIKLKGKLPRGLSYQNPTIAECVVIENGPKPETTTAVKLTKTYATNRKAAKEKYREKWVNLEGEIIDAKVVAGNDMIVRLKGDGDLIVNCSIVKNGLEAAKPGQTVKVFGQLNVADADSVKVVYIYATALTELK